MAEPPLKKYSCVLVEYTNGKKTFPILTLYAANEEEAKKIALFVADAELRIVVEIKEDDPVLL